MKTKYNVKDFPIKNDKFKFVGEVGIYGIENNSICKLSKFNCVEIVCYKEDLIVSFEETEIDSLVIFKHQEKEILCWFIDKDKTLQSNFEEDDDYMFLCFFLELKRLSFSFPEWSTYKFLFERLRGYVSITEELLEIISNYAKELTEHLSERRKKFPILTLNYKLEDLELIYNLIEYPYMKCGILKTEEEIKQFNKLDKVKQVDCLKKIINIKSILFDILPRIRKGNMNFSLNSLYLKYTKKIMTKSLPLEIRFKAIIFLNLNKMYNADMLKFIKKYKEYNDKEREKLVSTIEY